MITSRPFGRGLGGFGRGGGWRHRLWATGRSGWSRFVHWPQPRWSVDDERSALERDAEALESELENLRARIDELNTASSE